MTFPTPSYIPPSCHPSHCLSHSSIDARIPGFPHSHLQALPFPLQVVCHRHCRCLPSNSTGSKATDGHHTPSPGFLHLLLA